MTAFCGDRQQYLCREIAFGESSGQQIPTVNYQLDALIIIYA